MYNNVNEIYDDYSDRANQLTTSWNQGQIGDVDYEHEIATLLKWYNAQLDQFNSENLFPGED